MPQLVVVEGPDAGKNYPLESVSVVGRHRTCSIVLTDDSVRRRHIKITKRRKCPSPSNPTP